MSSFFTNGLTEFINTHVPGAWANIGVKLIRHISMHTVFSVFCNFVVYEVL